MSSSIMIGMDVGGTRIRIGAVEIGEQEKYRLAAPCEVFTSDMISGPEMLCRELIQLIHRYAADQSIRLQDVQAVSIGIPGAVADDCSTVYRMPNISRDIRNLSLGRQMTEQLRRPVYINNDVRNLLYCDMQDFKLKGVVAACYIGTGIGSAVSVNGQMLYGAHGLALDIGHLSMRGERASCGCGKTGCMEAVASGHVFRQLQERAYTDTPMSELFRRHGHESDVCALVEDCAWIPAILAGVFDPDTLVIGGGVTEMAGFPKEVFQNRILELTTGAVAESGMKIRYSPKRDDKGVIGAVIFACQKQNL